MLALKSHIDSSPPPPRLAEANKVRKRLGPSDCVYLLQGGPIGRSKPHRSPTDRLDGALGVGRV